MFVAWLFKFSTLRSKRFKVAPSVARLPATVLRAVFKAEIAANALAAPLIEMLEVVASIPNFSAVVFANLIVIC